MNDRPPPIVHPPAGDRGVEPDGLRAYTGVATVPPAVLMNERPPDAREDEEGSSPLDLADWIDFLLGALS